MRIGIHVELERLRIQSGVPRHIREVAGRLLKDGSLNTHLFVEDRTAENVLSTLPEPWPSAERMTFGYPASLMRRLWGTIGWPSYERLGGDADWLYLPNDSYVPTTSAKLAVTVHDLYRLDASTVGNGQDVSRFQRLRHRLLLSKIARHADAILTVSTFTADRIMDVFDVPASRIQVIYNGINNVFFESPTADAESKIRDDFDLQGPYVTSVGGLKPKKNADGLLRAWTHIRDEHPDWTLVLVGHNAPGWVERARSTGRVRVVSGLSDVELRDLISFSKCQFLPSWYEGFGLPALEALAAGTPVVLSDIPAFREVVGEWGRYVDPSAPKQMANAVMSVATNREHHEAVRTNGPEHARTFTWDACAARVRSVLS